MSRNPWTEMEVEALKDGVKKHGSGNWMIILRDPELGPKLINRNNVNLKTIMGETFVCEIWDGRNDLSGLGYSLGKEMSKEGIYDLPKIQDSKDKWRHIEISEEKLQRAKKTYDFMTPKGETTSSTSGSTLLDYGEAIKYALQFTEDPRGSEFITIAAFIEQHLYVDEDYLNRVEQELVKLIEENKVERDEAGFYKWLN